MKDPLRSIFVVACVIRVALLCGGLLIVPLIPSFAQDGPADTEKVWVFFTDKQESGRQQVVRRADVTSRTLHRRAARGTRSGTWDDLPVSEAYVEAVEAAAGDVLVRSRWLNAVSVVVSPAERELLEALPFVRLVQRVGSLPQPRPDSRAVDRGTSLLKRGTIDFGPSLQQIAFVNAVSPIEEGIDGAGVRLGFLDTQFDFSHPALRHLADDGRLLDVRDFTQANQDVYGGNQSNYHGLSVASVAVGYDPGNLIGPAHGVEVIAATTEFAPTETNQEEDNFVAGLEWLESEGVDVVNVSLGYTEFDAGQYSYRPEDMDGDTGITTIAADRAAQLGVVVVVSAGNAGATAWRIIGTPADGDSVIAVGASRPDSVIANFSSVGPTADGRIKPDVTALGTNVTFATPGGGYGSGNGTSFSSPMVAAVVCQMLQVNPVLSPMEVRDILQETASLAFQPNYQFGFGIIDAGAAIARARGDATTTPDPDQRSRVVVRSAYPNPFTETVYFDVATSSVAVPARLLIFDVLGRHVHTVFEGTLDAGTNRLSFRPTDLVAGVYYYRLESGSDSTVGSLVHIR